MRLTLECYILLFFTGAFLGWVMEVVCKLIQFGRFINRGFLIGPYCPIYGFGAVLVTALLTPFSASPPAVFVLAMAVCGTLEYLTSYVMEKLFHARWWDYSHRRFNLNGRVCAGTLIPFGLLGLGMVYVARPLLFGLYLKLPQPWMDGLCVGLCALLSGNMAPEYGASFGQPREDTMQYRIAAYLEQTPGATLLNYGFMDAGFYTAAGLVPNVKYFHQTNVPLQEMLTEQERYLREGRCDYVITRGKQPEWIVERYELIATESSPNFWYDAVYLYRQKSLSSR